MGVLRFGVGPIAAGEERAKVRAHAESALARAAGSHAILVVTKSYKEVEDKLARGEVDLAWLPPALCVRAIERGATLLLGCVRASEKTYRAVLFVRADSPRRVPADLSGARAAWVDPDSCSGYLFPRIALSEDHGLDPATLFGEEKMLGSHAAVVAAVTKRQADCGATFAAAVPDDMRWILTSAPIPNDAVCAAPSMDRARRDALGAALAELHRSADGALALRELFDVARLEPALPRHYDLVRRAMAGTGAAISSTKFR
jgi:phosphonate transport system substrate-binding protein